MTYKFDDITIVGGGSSGWMTAATFIRFFPNKNISIIESPDYPIVGVGESTLGQINIWKNLLGIEDKDFMKETDASYKMSIRFTDFYKKNSGGFHYPFGYSTYDEEFCYMPKNDWFIKKALYPETSVEDYAKTYFPCIPLIENNRISDNKNNEYEEFDIEWDTAYHFDATKFGQWLKKNYCIPKGVKLIQDTVEKITINEDGGIDNLELKSGKIHRADLYIDCTGFKSLLLGQSLKEEFISFNDLLPNNKAWAVHLPYVDKEKELECFTNSTALSNGWCWNIPLWSRIGTGYVYSDKYINDDEALEEFKDYLMSDKMVIPRKKEEIDNLKYTNINMRVGIHNKTWVKNVVAIGLSAGFIEPLESNGLFTVHEFLLKLIKTLQRSDSISQFDIDIYNTTTKEMFYEFSEFVALHYSLSARDDSEYWRENTRKTNRMLDDLVYRNVKPSNASLFLKWSKMNDNRFPVDGLNGIITVSAGMNFKPLEKIDIELMNISKTNKINFTEIIDNLSSGWDKKYKHRTDKALKCQTLYEYLKNNIHTSNK